LIFVVGGVLRLPYSEITKWIDELLLTGSVQLKRPVKFLIQLQQIDIEAEEMERLPIGFSSNYQAAAGGLSSSSSSSSSSDTILK